MKTLVLVDAEQLSEEAFDLFGEGQLFVDDELNVVTEWSRNDANYRSEYMSPLIKYFGGKISTDPTEAAIDAANDYVLKNF